MTTEQCLNPADDPPTDSNTLDTLKPFVILPCKTLKIKHSDVCFRPPVALFVLKPKPEVSDSNFTQTFIFFYFIYCNKLGER